ncbi:putative fungal specific transcription factor [Lyophyllum shimeji]|uniref:Fungal specific transcription factor n=1 Tax=Lyophyllum shimeji TaxID=47721 RepID=A0A9P3UN55_LYOSH|nr:putative fungal specific transcription factor [Lyophyllum shimeji]
MPSYRRPEFWLMPPREHEWEELHKDSPQLISSVLANFPADDLASELIDLYFLHANSRFPLLHRPTFEKQWKEKLHQTNSWFTAVCLGLFAVASRWSFDRRVLPEAAATAPGEPDWKLAGSKYFELGTVLHEVRRSLFYPANLLEMQAFTLFTLYLRGTAHYPMTWLIVGIAIRKLQDVGAHRKKVYQAMPAVEAELWKRAFWCLLVFDRIECAPLGRGCTVGQEDFDVDLPLEVDDEYWEAEDPAMSFRQPEGVPAKICLFNQVIKLSQVMAFALKTVYVVDRSKIFFGLTPASWRREVIAQMDSALNEWLTSLPEHLAWPKHPGGSPCATDVVTLQIIYHLIQILIYKPLIPSPFTSSSSCEPSLLPSHPSSTSCSALDRCVEAAQACARVAETQALQGLPTSPTHIYAAKVSSAVLLVKIWDVKLREKAMRAQGIEDFKPLTIQIIEPLMADVFIFVRVLEQAEPRWGIVGPFLQELRESLPKIPGTSLTPLHWKNTLRHHSQFSEHGVPSPPARPRQRSHSLSQPPHTSPRWDEVRLLTELRASGPLRPTHSSHGTPGTTEQGRPTIIAPRPGIDPYSAFDWDSRYAMFPDDLSIPSPYEQVKSAYSAAGLVATPVFPIPRHLSQRSAPYVGNAADQSVLPPPNDHERRRYSHNHKTKTEGGITHGDVNIAFDHFSRPRGMDGYSHNMPPGLVRRSSFYR